MKKSYLKYPDSRYEGIYSLLVQRFMIMMFLKDIIKYDTFEIIGIEVDAWRYVFEQDISKSRIIKNLSKAGVDNLVALEVIDKLNNVRRIVNEVVEKECIKK